MSTLRISNIEAKADSSSPTVDEQLKFTNSDGDVLLHLDGRTAGITTVGINTTNSTIKFDANNNILITGIVTATEFHGTLAVGTSVTYGDNEKAYFGTGLDLSIYHNGSHSYIEDTGTGSLYIDSNQLYLRNNDTSNVLLYTTSGGEVRINHNGTTKLTTKGYGIDITGGFIATGNSIVNDNGKIQLGTGGDLQLYHDGTNSVIDNLTGGLFIKGGTTNGITFQNRTGNESMARFLPDGAVELYHNNVKKFETTSAGADFTLASSGQVNLYGLGGTNGLRISGPQSASSAFLFFNTNHQNVSGGTDQYTIQCGGANHTLMFKHGNSTGNVVFELDDIEHVRIPQDNKALKIGAGQDLQLSHNATDSYVKNNTGHLRIGNTHDSSNIKFFTNNSTRWNIDSNGHFVPDSNNTFDIGTSSYRVKDLYISGISLTNSGTNATEQTATFLTSNSGTHNRIVIKTSTNNGGDPYIKFDAGGQDMIVGTRYAGTTNNLLVLGPGLDPDTTYGVFVKGNGRVGVGSDNPQHTLDVFGAIRSHQQTPSLYLQTTANTAESAIIRFGDAGSFQRAGIQYDFAGDNHLIIKMGGAGNNVERMRIRGTDGAIKIGGHSANRDMGGLSYQKVHIEGTDGGSSAIGIFNNQNSTGSSGLYLGKSRGTSVGANTIVQDDDTLGSIVWVGADGNDAISQGAMIQAKVDGTPGSNDMPGRLVFSTTPEGGSSTVVRRMTIGQDGHVEFRQHGNSKTYFFSSGKSGSYSQLTIIIDAHAWHSFVITVAHGGYAGSWSTAKYMGYENGTMYYANEGTETTDSNSRNVTHSQNPGGGHKHRIEITGGMGTHPVCELRITIGGNDAYIDSGDITFTWS